MSSVVSQRALLLALGGVSLAALFWYFKSKKDTNDSSKQNSRGKFDAQMEEVECNGNSSKNERLATISSADVPESGVSNQVADDHPSDPVAKADPETIEPIENPEQEIVEDPLVAANAEVVVVEVEAEPDIDEIEVDVPLAAGGDCIQISSDHMIDSEGEVSAVEEDPNSLASRSGAGDGPLAKVLENEKPESNGDIVIPSDNSIGNEDEIVVQRINETTATPLPSQNGFDIAKTEPVATQMTVESNESATRDKLSLDCTHVPSESAPFSWSAEMEMDRSYAEVDDNKLNKEQSYEQSESPGAVSQDSEAKKMMLPPLVHPALIPTHLPPPPLPVFPIPQPYCVPAQLHRPQSPIRLPLTIRTISPGPPSSCEMRRYSSGSSVRSSSCAASTSSNVCETVSSQDSGRATGGLASSLSPMDDGLENLPLYEFEIPNSLVGLIIGIKGKTIKELSTRTEVKMLIRQHYVAEKIDTHQICQVRGKRDQINRCLQMLRRRFPPNRFPDLNLQPVLPPPLPTNLFDAFAAQPCWLTLPERIPCEVVCSSIMNPGHFFLQQPTHPTYSSLAHLDMYMLSLYSQSGAIPELPKPCQTGLLCAAPVLSAWFRAVTVAYYDETDEVLLRFVDYGGYSTVPRADLRQIRTDLMSLPFQSTECYLAHVQPVDGTWQWSEAASEYFKELVANKVINATLIGHHTEQKVHMVELTVEIDGKPVRVDRALMDAGHAKASDPSKMVPVQSSINGVKRQSLKTQSLATS